MGFVEGFSLRFSPVGFRPARTRAMQAFVVGSMEASHDSYDGRRHYFQQQGQR